MPGQRPTYEDLFDMPKALRTFVLSKEFEDADATLQATYRLSEEQTIALGDAIMAAIYNDIDLGEAVARIRQRVMPNPIADPVAWKKFLEDFLRAEIWPLRELFGSELTSLLEESQIASASWPAVRVLIRPLTYSGAASELATRMGIDLSVPPLHERLRDLFMSHVKGIRADGQVIEMLMRPANLGGMGLDAATAEKVLAAMNSLMRDVDIMSEEEYAEWLARQAQKKADMPKKALLQTPEQAEIAKLSSAMAVSAQPKSLLDNAIATTIGSLPKLPTEGALQGRLAHLIATRFRDVRSAIEFRQLLERDAKVGGLGYSSEDADRVASVVEDAYRTHHEPILADEKQKLDLQIEQQKTKIEERRKREAEEHAQWFQERVAERKKNEDQKNQLVEQFRTTMLPIDAKQQRKETERFGEMVPASSPAARPEVKVSAATVQLQASQLAQKPRMDDVVPAPVEGGPKLVGLLQELRQLSLTEFRRMGTTPEQATQKIIQKFETLGQESFEKRLEGVRAWQASPLQEVYLRLVSEAFAQGKTVVQIAEQKRASSEDTLRPEEVTAIISLNSTLHY